MLQVLPQKYCCQDYVLFSMTFHSFPAVFLPCVDCLSRHKFKLLKAWRNSVVFVTDLLVRSNTGACEVYKCHECNLTSPSCMGSTWNVGGTWAAP